MLSLLPENTAVLHIGLFREKVSLQPVEYYSKVRKKIALKRQHCFAEIPSLQLPAEPSADRVFILDPLVATGGTAIVSKADEDGRISSYSLFAFPRLASA
jgi:uracil phosphoribosyltransferase